MVVVAHGCQEVLVQAYQLAGPWLLSEGRKKVGGAFIMYQNLETPISRITCPQGQTTYTW